MSPRRRKEIPRFFKKNFFYSPDYRTYSSCSGCFIHPFDDFLQPAGKRGRQFLQFAAVVVVVNTILITDRCKDRHSLQNGLEQAQWASGVSWRTLTFYCSTGSFLSPLLKGFLFFGPTACMMEGDYSIVLCIKDLQRNTSI